MLLIDIIIILISFLVSRNINQLYSDCFFVDMTIWNLQIQMETRNDLIKKLILKSGQRYEEHVMLTARGPVVSFLQSLVFLFVCYRVLTSKLEIAYYSIFILTGATMSGDINSW